MILKFKISFLLVLIMLSSACGGRMSSQAGENLSGEQRRTNVKKLRMFNPALVSALTKKASRTMSKDESGLNRTPAVEIPAGVMPEGIAPERNIEDQSARLDQIAALERAGSWFQGMGLAESGLRESCGDYAGAVTAAYKELTWAYGKGLIKKEDLEQGLLNLLDAKNDEAVITTAKAILSFARGQWAQASTALFPLFDEFEEPDGFGRWMILVCALEKNREDKRAGAAYKAIRARYVQQPEYWYRGARAFSGILAAEYAEYCINLSPQGPFTGECRRILASFAGLKKEDGASLKTKTEIEEIISKSVNTGNPQILDTLFPLISLPDNPYTVYAVGALRALTSVPKYRDFFNRQASASKGRLAERLSYICRS
jgi:hypothetical protein